MPEAKGTFSISSWEGETYEESEGAVLSRATLTKVFQGDFEGTGSAELLMAEAQDSRAYVGMERIDGRLNGSAGTFVVQHSAVSSKDGDRLTVVVVPDSGTAGLAGITGTMEISVDDGGGHNYSFTYSL
ncbi:MAG TPA: DUF3224 domain-containing protein [Actinomycetota bacterium]|nr:DUF3224 domain-containing protein [Actinomycetota bacterium]